MGAQNQKSVWLDCSKSIGVWVEKKDTVATVYGYSNSFGFNNNKEGKQGTSTDDVGDGDGKADEDFKEIKQRFLAIKRFVGYLDIEGIESLAWREKACPKKVSKSTKCFSLCKEKAF